MILILESFGKVERTNGCYNIVGESLSPLLFKSRLICYYLCKNVRSKKHSIWNSSLRIENSRARPGKILYTHTKNTKTNWSFMKANFPNESQIKNSLSVLLFISTLVSLCWNFICRVCVILKYSHFLWTAL